MQKRFPRLAQQLALVAGHMLSHKGGNALNMNSLVWRGAQLKGDSWGCVKKFGIPKSEVFYSGARWAQSLLPTHKQHLHLWLSAALRLLIFVWNLSLLFLFWSLFIFIWILEPAHTGTDTDYSGHISTVEGCRDKHKYHASNSPLTELHLSLAAP